MSGERLISDKRRESILFSPERFDWDGLSGHYSWISKMVGVPQNARYHAEGDVWTHTRMVVEALISLPEWQSLPARERRLLYAAALLHDVAKPDCTIVDDSGNASSPGHARRGEPMTREVLEQCHVEAYADRELVAILVRYHGLPLWFLERIDLERSLVRASIDVPLHLVALLAEAEVRGRICEDQQNLLDTIDLFRDACRTLQCFTAPRAFYLERN